MTQGTSEQGRGVSRVSSRTASWLAWSLCVLSLALTALSLLLLALNLSHPRIPVYPFWPVNTLLALGNSIVGAVVASRRPQHPIGWLMCAAGLVWGVVHFCGEYAIYALLAQPGSLPAGKAVAWFFTWLWAPALGLVVFLGLLFPTGRLPSSRWRPFAWLSFLITLIVIVLSVFAPGSIIGLGSIRNPLGIEGWPTLYEPLQSLMLVLVFVGSASMLGRLRQARGVERQQIKWPAYTVMMAASGSVLTYTVSEAIGARWLELAGFVVFIAALVGFPTSIGIAIVRYRLYDIDRIINRTLVYGSLTAILAAHYFGSIVWLQIVFVELTGQRSTLAVVASTLVIAALFNPWHRWVQAFVDRRFYRSKYDARKTLEAFSAKLRDETDLDTLSDDLVGVVRETMQPAHVSLWLRPDTASKGQHTD
jgi:hypothetical protein